MNHKYDNIVFPVAVLFLLQGYVVGATATDDKPKPLQITRVGLSSKSFDPSKNEIVTLSFEVTKQANVFVTFHDVLGREARSFSLPSLEAGRHIVTWDGRNADGKLAPGNLFLYVIEAKTSAGGHCLLNPAGKTGGFKARPLKYTLDRKTGKIEYVLPKACMIRIRAGLKDGMFAKQLFEWQPMPAGRHVYKWDGTDESGMLNLFRHRDLDIRLTCYTLPDNTVITTGNILPIESEKVPAKSTNNAREHLWSTKGKYFHYQHDPRICRPPRFNVLLPTASTSEEDDCPVVSGVVPIRIELDPRDAPHVVDARFEIMLFIDGVFIYEIEEGSSPFTFNWDSTGFAKGPHVLTVNLAVYDDHMGIISEKIMLGE